MLRPHGIATDATEGLTAWIYRLIGGGVTGKDQFHLSKGLQRPAPGLGLSEQNGEKMKNLLLLVVTSSFLAIAGVTASAQIVYPIEADIPFDFTVRQTALPAGHYTVRRLGSDPEVMEIVGDDYRHPSLFLVESAQVSNSPKSGELIFDRVGDRYFLSQVFEGGTNVGVEVPKSRAERRMEKEGAMTQVHAVIVPARNALRAKS